MDEMEWIVSQLKSKKRRKIMETRKLKKKKKEKMIRKRNCDLFGGLLHITVHLLRFFRLSLMVCRFHCSMRARHSSSVSAAAFAYCQLRRSSGLGRANRARPASVCCRLWMFSWVSRMGDWMSSDRERDRKTPPWPPPGRWSEPTIVLIRWTVDSPKGRWGDDWANI